MAAGLPTADRAGAEAGFDMLDITTPWTPGQTRPDPGELKILRNVAASTSRRHSRLLITVYAPRPRYAPSRRISRTSTRSTWRRWRAISRASETSLVWNEPNLNGFWLHQFDESGRDVAAPAYTSLLARSYDALKDVSPKIRSTADRSRRAARTIPMGGGTRTLQPRSSATWAAPIAAPAGPSRSWTSSQSTRTFSSRRMPPSTKHPGTTIGIADYDKLVRCSARPSTARPSQARSCRSPTRSSASRRRSPERQASYTNLALAARQGRGATRRRRRDYYSQAFELAACQPTVDRVSSSTCSTRPTSTVAVRPLLPGHEAEVEPRRRSRRPRRRHARGSSRLFVRFG